MSNFSDTPGTIYIHASGNGVSNTTALNAVCLEHEIHLETAGEVFIKFGLDIVTVTLSDFHLHLLGGTSRTVLLPAAASVTHIAAWGIGSAHDISLWRTDGA
jgi:hypothetical protein